MPSECHSLPAVLATEEKAPHTPGAERVLLLLKHERSTKWSVLGVHVRLIEEI